MKLGGGLRLTATGVAAFIVAVIVAAEIVVWLDLEPPERAQRSALFPAQRVALLLLFVITLTSGILVRT